MNKLSLYLLVITFAAVNAGTIEDFNHCLGYCLANPDDDYEGKGCLIGCLEHIEKFWPGHPFETIDWQNGYKEFVDKSTQTDPCENWCEGAHRGCHKHNGVHECTSACEKAQNRKESVKERDSALGKLRDILRSCLPAEGFYH